jgi:hypothetical protein
MPGVRVPCAAMLEREQRVPLVIAAVSLVWFAATLWFAHTSVVAAAGFDGAARVTALFVLPLLVASAFVAGAATALVVAARFVLPRALVGAGVGLVVGGIAGALVLVTYGAGSALVPFAIAIVLAAAVGGALAGVPTPVVLVAGLAACLSWFAVGLLERLISATFPALFRAGSTPSAQLAAAYRLSLTAALIGGAVAGLVAFWHLRPHGLAWPAYAAAGATPGLLLLLADAAARLGGGPLLRLAATSSAADRVALDFVAANRLSTALVVLFTGAIAAIIAHGRTLKPASR